MRRVLLVSLFIVALFVSCSSGPEAKNVAEDNYSGKIVVQGLTGNQAVLNGTYYLKKNTKSRDISAINVNDFDFKSLEKSLYSDSACLKKSGYYLYVTYNLGNPNIAKTCCIGVKKDDSTKFEVPVTNDCTTSSDWNSNKVNFYVGSYEGQDKDVSSKKIVASFLEDMSFSVNPNNFPFAAKIWMTSGSDVVVRYLKMQDSSRGFVEFRSSPTDILYLDEECSQKDESIDEFCLRFSFLSLSFLINPGYKWGSLDEYAVSRITSSTDANVTTYVFKASTESYDTNPLTEPYFRIVFTKDMSFKINNSPL